MGTCKIGLQWTLVKGSRAEGGVASKLRDSVDDNERWDSVGFSKNACMHVWGHVKLGCNGVLIETFPLVKGRGCGFQTQGLDSVDDNESWDCVGFCKMLACMFGDM